MKDKLLTLTSGSDILLSEELYGREMGYFGRLIAFLLKIR